jgi:predicted alpha/beta-fold hydrolase
MSDDFRPAFGMANPHVQTIWGRLTRSGPRMAVRREFLPTPDGDEIVLDHLEFDGSTEPRTLILHGLEGSSQSVYAQGFLKLFAARRLNVTAMNFRSCARDPKNNAKWIPNRGDRLYHSGETGDLGFVIDTMTQRDGRPVNVIGASIGGNVTLKWLGENPGNPRVVRAAALSVPVDLAACADHLEKGRMGPFYTSIFLSTLKPKVAELAARSPKASALFDPERVRRARTFREFDEAATARIHGFRDAADYYARASSLPYLERIATPTLLVNSADDPFIPMCVSDRLRNFRNGRTFRAEVTSAGGHVGFIAGSVWRPRFWVEERLVGWVTDGG